MNQTDDKHGAWTLASEFDAIWKKYEGNQTGLDTLGHWVRLNHEKIRSALSARSATAAFGKCPKCGIERDLVLPACAQDSCPSAVTETVPLPQGVADMIRNQQDAGADLIRAAHAVAKEEGTPRAEADADQAKDAARYRWLRDEGNNDWPSLVSAGISPPRIDAAIDAAMRGTDGPSTPQEKA